MTEQAEQSRQRVIAIPRLTPEALHHLRIVIDAIAHHNAPRASFHATLAAHANTPEAAQAPPPHHPTTR